MAERPTASPSGRRPAPRSAQPKKELHADTARIPLHGGRGAVPGWFWGLLGFLTVLGGGLAGLFFVVRSLPPPTASGGVAVAPGPGAASPASAARGGGIQVEQLKSPPPPALAPFPASKPKLPPHAVKVARSPSGPRGAADKAAPAEEGEAAPAPAETSDSDQKAGDDDTPRPHKPTATGDDDTPRPHKPTATGDDDAPRPHKATAAAARGRRERETPPADDSADDDN